MEREREKEIEQGGHCSRLSFAFDVHEILIEITRFLDLFIFVFLPLLLLLFFASSLAARIFHT